MKKRPNLLLIMGEASRPDFLSGAGHPIVKTPYLDRLMREGVYFDRAYCASSQCAPSRTSFVTGLYPHSHGVMFNEVEVLPIHDTIGDLLRPYGYRSGWFGKGHNTPCRAPMGFDELHMCESGRLPMYDDDYFCWLSERGASQEAIQQLWDEVWNVEKQPFGRYTRPRRYQSPLGSEFSLSSWLTWEARRFIDSSLEEDRPFLAFVSHHAPQNDDALPEPYFSMYDPGEVAVPSSCSDPDTARLVIVDYMAKTSMLDAQVGEMINHLEFRGQLDNTIIVFTSDHACFLGEHDIYNKMWNYELDTRIPMIFRYPARVSAGLRSDALFSNIDALPTLLAMLEVPAPDNLQGTSQVVALTGGESPRRLVYCESGPAGQQRKSLRLGEWKLLYRTGKGIVELYDLRADPEERRNLADDPAHAAKRAELIEAMFLEIVTTERYGADMTERTRRNKAGLFSRL